jgi:type III restriction enzyme
VLQAGEATGDVSERDIRRIQIRETIKAHLDKEKQLFAQGIKVLSLFFIDEVAKYRDYDQADEKGEYARVFEEEYEAAQEVLYLSELAIDTRRTGRYLRHRPGQDPQRLLLHRQEDQAAQGSNVQVARRNRRVDSDDVDAYDLILKDKERLLSLPSRTRFIFSHSALREGWDNPNVFVMCMLKHSDNTISRRQEVGRGLRLSVEPARRPHGPPGHGARHQRADRGGERELQGLRGRACRRTSASPSRRVRGRQRRGISPARCSRPSRARRGHAAMAKQIYRYLVKNDYTDDADQIADAYHEAKAAGNWPLPPELKPHAEQVFQLIDSVFSDAQLPEVDDGRKPKTNPLNATSRRRSSRRSGRASTARRSIGWSSIQRS